MYYVYILRSQKDQDLYTGSTNDLKKRLLEHHKGLVVSTKNRRPLELIYYEAYLYKEEAKKKEVFYKSGRGHEVLYKNLFKTLGKIKAVV